MNKKADAAKAVPSVDFRAEYKAATLSNNFMFRLVMEKPELCRKLLERVLDMHIVNITYPEGEVSLEAKLASKGVRLDVYVTDEDGVAYDIEMQVDDRKKPALGKRTRYYQSQIDIDSLKKGQPYNGLEASYMTYSQTIMEERVLARAEGKAEGRKEGKAEGRKEGIKEGRKEGRKEGIINTLSSLVKDGIITSAEAAKRANLSIEDYSKAVAAL